MNAALWILQVLLAVHTLMGAVWKFSQSPGQTMPALAVIPGWAWLGMSVLEILCAIALILPAFRRQSAGLVPVAATIVALEMVLYTALHLSSGHRDMGPVAYWLFVALLCAVLAIGRRSARA